MELLQKLKLPLIEQLPERLGLPERYGAVALAPLIQLPLPELARIYQLLPTEQDV